MKTYWLILALVIIGLTAIGPFIHQPALIACVVFVLIYIVLGLIMSRRKP